MRDTPASGTEGYTESAAQLLDLYESFAFEDVHRPVLHLIPEPPSDVLDIGAGSGRDAAALAARGHRVVAVEPTAAMREGAARRHRSARITWIDDSLPDLRHIRATGVDFHVVMLSAVWMHLDEAQRRTAMPVVAALTRPGGMVFISLRHGPVPHGRRMFEVGGDETMALARTHALEPILRLRRKAVLPGNQGLSWTRLAFIRRR